MATGWIHPSASLYVASATVASKNSGGHQEAERQCGVAPCPATKDHFLPVQGNMPWPTWEGWAQQKPWLKKLRLATWVCDPPGCPCVGSSPDGIIFDPTESQPFGSIEIKSPNAKSHVDCSYLKMHSGTLKLKQSHSNYWQVQGWMDWCDFVVFADYDILVQRIGRWLQSLERREIFLFSYFYMGQYLSNHYFNQFSVLNSSKISSWMCWYSWCIVFFFTNLYKIC